MIPPEGPRRILVLGGSGFVGRSVCERLVARSGGAGGAITVPSRRPQRAAHLRHLPTLALPAADLRDDATLAALVAGHDAVIHLVAILHGSAAQFHAVHAELPRRLAAACRAQGVRRLLHVSALGVAPDAPSDYLRSKAAGEAALLAAGLDLTIFRPSVIFGAADRFMNTFARLQSLAPVVPLAGASARFQPVWVEDVAAAIVAALDRPETIGRTYECAGPAEFTLAELVRLAGTWAGHPRPVFGLPDGIAGLQARLMECLPGEPLLSRDNLRSMQVPNVATGTLPGLAALGIDPADLRGVMADHLDGRVGPARLDRLRAPGGKRAR
ncbi:complex I NDUFA9 subunit family protein [Piscinibacter sakaiensis]|uniref:NAD-dependent epimerase/dehydratase n=1 Tax=Piscinibacter sakaiensis TaxID=1547922 RepID=A0A0K8P4L2_PISS1|nr:complex I NDUFA9 subunit family protein [Piscinibacter sakaiensis]GAP37597.1 NAD-dependent epimerase/dehydratase [Piscinibacter sakaiensis]